MRVFCVRATFCIWKSLVARAETPATIETVRVHVRVDRMPFDISRSISTSNKPVRSVHCSCSFLRGSWKFLSLFWTFWSRSLARFMNAWQLHFFIINELLARRIWFRQFVPRYKALDISLTFSMIICKKNDVERIKAKNFVNEIQFLQIVS